MAQKLDFDLAKVEELAGRGLSDSEIADYFGVSPSTISRRKGEPDFLRAIKKGRAQGIATVANALFEKAVGGDTSAMIFYLRSKANWVEPQRIKQEVVMPNRSASEMSNEELNAALAGHLLSAGVDEPDKHVTGYFEYLADKERGEIKERLREQIRG